MHNGPQYVACCVIKLSSQKVTKLIFCILFVKEYPLL